MLRIICTLITFKMSQNNFGMAPTLNGPFSKILPEDILKACPDVKTRSNQPLRIAGTDNHIIGN